MDARSQTVLDELVETSRELAWAQWRILGVSTWDTRAVNSLIDLESLIAFTAYLWDVDPRLGAQAIDWCAANMPLVSLHQLRSTITRHRWSFQGSVADFGATAGRFTHKTWPGTGESRLLLNQLPEKAGKPDLSVPPLQALRIRSIFGLGARSEIVRHLLFHDWPQTPRQLAKEVPYGSRQIANDLELMAMGGIVREQRDGLTRAYRLSSPEDVSKIVGPPVADVVPWGDVFKVLTELLDLHADTDVTGLLSPVSEFARRVRFLEPNWNDSDDTSGGMHRSLPPTGTQIAGWLG